MCEDYERKRFKYIVFCVFSWLILSNLMDPIDKQLDEVKKSFSFYSRKQENKTIKTKVKVLN